jgi:hypothetical protein
LLLHIQYPKPGNDKVTEQILANSELIQNTK